MRRMSTRARLVALVGLAALLGLTAWRLLGSGNGVAVYDFAGGTMGTTYSVKVETVPLSTERQDEIASIIQAVLDDIDRRMSTYDTASELSRFNAHHSTTRTLAGIPLGGTRSCSTALLSRSPSCIQRRWPTSRP